MVPHPNKTRDDNHNHNHNLHNKKGRRPSSRRRLRGVVYLLYVFVAVVAAGTVLCYLKILSEMNKLMASGGSTPMINGRPIHLPGHNIRFRSVDAAAAVAAALVSPTPTTTGSCAILLFGLPRAFKDYVLPSLEKNVLRPNARYGCDYFVHYYRQDSEAAGRSGRGGSIRADDIFLLEDSVATIFRDAHTNTTTTTAGGAAAAGGSAGPPSPTVTFVSDTNETFWDKRGDVIQRYRTAKNPDGNYSFYPYGERTYEYPGTLDNIVRQWHSVNAVWDAMEEASSGNGGNSNKNNKNNKNKNNRNKPHRYRRVAMMRVDVVYLTPIDIYSVPVVPPAAAAGQPTPDDAPHRTVDDYATNTRSVIPNFAKYPVNDRLIYGPRSAVEVWASQRFSRIEEYARDPSATPGMVMHSETFLNATILQAIREAGAHGGGGGGRDAAAINNNNNNSSNSRADDRPVLIEDPWMCFLRVRADGAIWIEDCDASKSGFGGGYPGGEAAYTELLREFLPNRGRGCKKRRLRDKVRRILELACPPPTTTTTTRTRTRTRTGRAS